MIVRPAGLWIADGKLLTMRYQYAEKDRFNLPGGNQEPGEEIRLGLIREFREELGVDVVVGDLLFTAETLVAEREVLHLLFEIKTLVGSPQINPQETKALELVWLEPEALKTTPMYPAVGSNVEPWIRSRVRDKIYFGRIFQDWIK